MALWLYAGPSVTESAWPTCVCVKPNDKRRNLNALANSLISSKSIPSTTLQLVWLIVGPSDMWRDEKKKGTEQKDAEANEFRDFFYKFKNWGRWQSFINIVYVRKCS